MSDTRTWQIQIIGEAGSITSYTVTPSACTPGPCSIEIYQGSMRIQATATNTGVPCCFRMGLLNNTGQPVNGSFAASLFPVATGGTFTYDRTFHFNNGTSVGDLPIPASTANWSNIQYTFVLQMDCSSACQTTTPICMAACSYLAVSDSRAIIVNLHGTIASIATWTPTPETPPQPPNTSIVVCRLSVRNDGNDSPGTMRWELYENPGISGEQLLAAGNVLASAGQTSQAFNIPETTPNAPGTTWSLGLKVYGSSEPSPAWGTLSTMTWSQGAPTANGEINNLIIGVVIIIGLIGGISLISKYAKKRR